MLHCFEMLPLDNLCVFVICIRQHCSFTFETFIQMKHSIICQFALEYTSRLITHTHTHRPIVFIPHLNVFLSSRLVFCILTRSPIIHDDYYFVSLFSLTCMMSIYAFWSFNRIDCRPSSYVCLFISMSPCLVTRCSHNIYIFTQLQWMIAICRPFFSPLFFILNCSFVFSFLLFAHFFCRSSHKMER